jgi:hypothetical protein
VFVSGKGRKVLNVFLGVVWPVPKPFTTGSNPVKA